MRILVTGGRDYSNQEMVNKILSKLNEFRGIEMIIEGGARSADSLARNWTRENSIPVKTVYADWNRYGKKAGPIRNQKMLDEEQPDYVLVFPGGRGTQHMKSIAQKVGVKIMEVLGKNY